jgi:hypothetical protein
MAKRTVDKRKTMKALRKLRRAAERARAKDAPDLTAWEKDFVEGVTGRLETYGSAFRDPGKGRLEDALSQRQADVARAIDKKTRTKRTDLPGEKIGQVRSKASNGGLRRGELKRRAPIGQSRPPGIRDVSGDVPAGPDPGLTPEQNRAALRVVPGGKSRGRSR